MAKVLVLDDNPAGRRLLATLLEHAGHTVLEAAMGEEAVALTRSERPDLVISDMLMPRMDGYQVARELRGDPEVGRTPIIFYSATYDDGELERLARECGGARVLRKPAEPAVLMAVVDEALAEALEERAC